MVKDDIPENQLGQKNVNKIIQREKILKDIKDFKKKYDEMFSRKNKDKALKK